MWVLKSSYPFLLTNTEKEIRNQELMIQIFQTRKYEKYSIPVMLIQTIFSEKRSAIYSFTENINNYRVSEHYKKPK